MLRAMSQGGMMGMRGQPNGMGMAPNDLARKAMQNNNRNMYVCPRDTGIEWL